MSILREFEITYGVWCKFVAGKVIKRTTSAIAMMLVTAPVSTVL